MFDKIFKAHHHVVCNKNKQFYILTKALERSASEKRTRNCTRNFIYSIENGSSRCFYAHDFQSAIDLMALVEFACQSLMLLTLTGQD